MDGVRSLRARRRVESQLQLTTITTSSRAYANYKQHCGMFSWIFSFSKSFLLVWGAKSFNEKASLKWAQHVRYSIWTTQAKHALNPSLCLPFCSRWELLHNINTQILVLLFSFTAKQTFCQFSPTFEHQLCHSRKSQWSSQLKLAISKIEMNLVTKTFKDFLGTWLSAFMSRKHLKDKAFCKRFWG